MRAVQAGKVLGKAHAAQVCAARFHPKLAAGENDPVVWQQEQVVVAGRNQQRGSTKHDGKEGSRQ